MKQGLFFTLLEQPIINLLVLLIAIIPGNDIGLAIIALTVIIKLLLHPLMGKSLKNQKALQEIQPKLEEIKKKYADNKEAQAQAMMKLYKDEKINPLSSCLPLLIQLPILLAVFRVFQNGLNNESLQYLYTFIPNPQTINPIAFGFVNMAEPNVVLAVLAGAAQFFQAKMMNTKKAPKKAGEGAKDENMMAAMNKQMLYFMPALTIIIGVSLPAGLTLYWFVLTLLTIVQQYFLFRKKDDNNEQPPQIIEGEKA